MQAPEWVTATLAKDDFQTKTMQRVALYPLDWFRAFLALREKGKGEEVIAAPFFVTLQIVKQWLKSASVAHALPNRLVSKKFQAGVPRAGVSVTQGRDGSLAVGRGYVQPEDDPPEEAAGQDVVGAYTMGQGGDVGAFSLKPSATFAWASRVPEARIIGAAREARGGDRLASRSPEDGRDGTEAERPLTDSGWLPEVLRRADPAALDGEVIAEGQGGDANHAEDDDLAASLTADLPDSDASLLAAE